MHEESSQRLTPDSPESWDIPNLGLQETELKNVKLKMQVFQDGYMHYPTHAGFLYCMET